MQSKGKRRVTSAKAEIASRTGDFVRPGLRAKNNYASRGRRWSGRRKCVSRSRLETIQDCFRGDRRKISHYPTVVWHRGNGWYLFLIWSPAPHSSRRRSACRDDSHSHSHTQNGEKTRVHLSCNKAINIVSRFSTRNEKSSLASVSSDARICVSPN